MLSMLASIPGVGFQCQNNGCMDLATLAFRGENGKLDRCLWGINCFGGCNTHLFTRDNTNFTSSPLKDGSQEKLESSK